MAGGLTAKQQAFVDEYLVDFNGRQAAIRAGYSAKTAEVQASRLLSKANIKELVELRRKELSEQAGDLRERVVQQLSRRAFRDVRGLFKDDGSLKLPHEWDDDLAAAVDGLDVSKIVSRNGDDSETEEFIRKVKLSTPDKALEMLGKHLGIFKDESTPAGNVFNVQINIG